MFKWLVRWWDNLGCPHPECKTERDGFCRLIYIANCQNTKCPIHIEGDRIVDKEINKMKRCFKEG